MVTFYGQNLRCLYIFIFTEIIGTSPKPGPANRINTLAIRLKTDFWVGLNNIRLMIFSDLYSGISEL